MRITLHVNFIDDYSGSTQLSSEHRLTNDFLILRGFLRLCKGLTNSARVSTVLLYFWQNIIIYTLSLESHLAERTEPFCS